MRVPWLPNEPLKQPLSGGPAVHIATMCSVMSTASPPPLLCPEKTAHGAHEIPLRGVLRPTAHSAGGGAAASNHPPQQRRTPAWTTTALHFHTNCCISAAAHQTRPASAAANTNQPASSTSSSQPHPSTWASRLVVPDPVDLASISTSLRPAGAPSSGRRPFLSSSSPILMCPAA